MNKISPVLAFAFLSVLASPAFASGVVDGGGGGVGASSPEQVRESIQKVWRLLTDSNLGVHADGSGMPLLRSFWVSPYIQRSLQSGDRQLIDMIAQPNRYGAHAGDPAFADGSSVIAKSALKVQDEACLDPKGAEVDAAVSRRAIGSEICFSAGRLTRLPPQALNDQITALFFHEIAHLYGADEDQATRIQQYVLDNINWIYSRASSVAMDAVKESVYEGELAFLEVHELAYRFTEEGQSWNQIQAVLEFGKAIGAILAAKRSFEYLSHYGLFESPHPELRDSIVKDMVQLIADAEKLAKEIPGSFENSDLLESKVGFQSFDWEVTHLMNSASDIGYNVSRYTYGYDASLGRSLRRLGSETAR